MQILHCWQLLLVIWDKRVVRRANSATAKQSPRDGSLLQQLDLIKDDGADGSCCLLFGPDTWPAAAQESLLLRVLSRSRLVLCHLLLQH